MEPKIEDQKLSTPLAIIFAGILIAGAVLYVNGGKTVSNNIVQQQAGVNQAAQKNDTFSLDQMRPISNNDHIRGSADAQVLVVEYSDPECPFCKQFHQTMKQVMAEYGADNKVAWVYRHFPLAGLHPKAHNEAIALECATEQGGNDKFWQYTDRLYEVTPSNNGLDPAELPKIAADVGLKAPEFAACLASAKYSKYVDDDIQNAIATGGNGTPWSIVVSKNGKKTPLSGAQPYASVKQIIETALQEK